MEMKHMKQFFRIGAIAALTVGLMAMAPAHAKKLKIQTSANASHFSLAYLNANWVEELKKRTNGRWEIELLPIRSVVPHRDTPKAVANGILDGDLTSTSYFSGLDPAFALIGDLIAGYDTPQQIQDYCRNGGGKEILQKLFDKYQSGVTVVACGTYNREAFVSKVPIKGIADFKGKKVRSPEGLASEVFSRVGATPVALPGSEVYTSLEKGIIDAADNSAYSNNDANGLHKIAKFPIYPGIHSMPVLQFTLSTSVWKKMSDEDKKIIEQWYQDAYKGLTAASDAKDKELVKRDKAGSDITVIDWPQAERDKFREIATGAWEAFAKATPLGKEAYDSHMAYMKKVGLLK
jgi:TRAP-type C4-dicarboxylate transport system substrate-binding protein